MKAFFCVYLLIFASGLTAQPRVFDSFDEFETTHLKDLSADKTYVINFWATWCAPCVKELPYFEALNQSGVAEVLLVSLDFKSQLEKRLLPFLEKKQLKSEVVVLADGRANSWIDRVSPEWSGAIPATVIVTNGKAHFFEKSYHSYAELKTEIENTRSK